MLYLAIKEKYASLCQVYCEGIQIIGKFYHLRDQLVAIQCFCAEGNFCKTNPYKQANFFQNISQVFSAFATEKI